MQAFHSNQKIIQPTVAMNLDLTGKTALVGGASQGIGAAAAHELALLGATVVVWARNDEKLQAVTAALPRPAGQQHRYLKGDAYNPHPLLQQLAAWQAEGLRFQLLVNNTGGPPSGSMIETSAIELEKAFSAHLVTSHLLVQALFGDMKAAGYGRIVNIVSTSVKQPIPALGISNTVRAAVANWAKTLANEISHHGITVNNVLPGFIDTERLQYLFGKQADLADTDVAAITHANTQTIPAGRLGQPQELAAAIAFLCSPAAAYINGINLPVDGGRLGGL